MGPLFLVSEKKVVPVLCWIILACQSRYPIVLCMLPFFAVLAVKSARCEYRKLTMEQILPFQSIACATSLQSSPLTILPCVTLFLTLQVQSHEFHSLFRWSTTTTQIKWTNESIQRIQKVSVGQFAWRREEQGPFAVGRVVSSCPRFVSPSLRAQRW